MDQALHVLNALEKEGTLTRYAIGGAIGALFYTEPFTTFDLDVFVIIPQPTETIIYSLQPLYARLQELGYPAEKECVNIGGIPVQFLPTYNPLLEEALNAAIDTHYNTIPTRVLSAEHLVAISVQTGRPKDRARIPMFQEANVLNESKLVDILTRYHLMEKWLLWTSSK